MSPPAPPTEPGSHEAASDSAALADVRLTLLFHLDWLLMGLAALLAMVRLGAGESAGVALREVAPWFLLPLALNLPLGLAARRLGLRLRPDAGFGDAVWVIFVVGFMTRWLDVYGNPAANGLEFRHA